MSSSMLTHGMAVALTLKSSPSFLARWALARLYVSGSHILCKVLKSTFQYGLLHYKHSKPLPLSVLGNSEMLCILASRWYMSTQIEKMPQRGAATLDVFSTRL